MNHNKLKILIIEDEPILRENIAHFLELKNFKVTQAKNGLEGLHMLKKTDPDLIICDISMPAMNGHQVLNEVRKDCQYAHIPFIFMTAKAEKSDLRHGMISGADDYIIKPVTFKELFHSIQKRMERLSQLKSTVQFTNSYAASISLSSEDDQEAIAKIPSLTNKELSILKRIANGQTTLLISEELSRSIRTIENHRQNTCKKLNIKGSNSLTRFALKFRNLI